MRERVSESVCGVTGLTSWPILAGSHGVCARLKILQTRPGCACPRKVRTSPTAPRRAEVMPYRKVVIFGCGGMRPVGEGEYLKPPPTNLRRGSHGHDLGSDVGQVEVAGYAAFAQSPARGHRADHLAGARACLVHKARRTGLREKGGLR